MSIVSQRISLLEISGSWAGSRKGRGRKVQVLIDTMVEEGLINLRIVKDSLCEFLIRLVDLTKAIGSNLLVYILSQLDLGKSDKIIDFYFISVLLDLMLINT